MNGPNEKTVTRRHVLRDEEAAKIPAAADGVVMVRPEHMRLAPAGGGGFPCIVRRIQFLGSFTRYMAECPALGADITVESTRHIDGISENDAAVCDFGGEDAIFYGTAS